jgi:hypothetical protein
MRGCEGGRERLQDSRSIKPGFRNANLLITHVLDMCVNLLVVSNISSAQDQSVHLSVEIATGRRRMIDIICSWSFGSSAIWRMISRLRRQLAPHVKPLPTMF